ncbi:ras guanine nucleotide exchange factor i-related [Anaeramoeba ignava]|uniref:Ras guanine nucleotide exchange factor i-related n=1 Tax=Anaeramoeba ignava TaxID=1746090 RepID=A0A9Q0R7K3_ANAIG|nr:ras guanine nucleotide exchange factor i-related [Anaeramoeba ignava]
MNSQLKIGQKVQVKNQNGIIKFLGNTEFATGFWIGIELETPTGRNDGSINGVKYFECKENHGIFVRESYLFPPKDAFDLIDDETLRKIEAHGFLLENLAQNSNKKIQLKEFEEQIIKKGEIGKSFLENQKKQDQLSFLKKEKFVSQREIERLTFEENLLKKQILDVEHLIDSDYSKIGFESNLKIWNDFNTINQLIEEERIQVESLESKNRILMQNIENARKTAKKQNEELKNNLKKKEEYMKKIEESKKNLRGLLNSKGLLRHRNSSTKKIKNKIKEVESKIREKKKILIGIEQGKSKHKREMESVLEIHDETDRSDWESRVMKRHPEILELRERIKPVQRAVSFSRYYCGAKTEIIDGLTKEVISQLIMQHYDFYNQKEITKVLEEKTSIQYQEDKGKLQDSRLMTLLQLGIIDSENLWDLVMKSSNTEGMTNEERYELFQDRADKMGLDFILENDTPIWEEGPDNEKNIIWENVKEDEDDSTKKVDFLSTISAANINKLIEKLTYEKGTDPKFVQAMLMTYQSFMKPEHLLLKLIQRYQVPVYDAERNESEKDWIKNKDIIQLRVSSIINLWIQKHPGDFDSKLITKLERFLNQHLKFDKPGMEEKIRAQLQKIKAGEKMSLEKGMSFADSPPEPKVPPNIFSKTLRLEDLEEEEFARQITLFVFSVFHEIQPSELVLQAWSKQKLKQKAPNVLYMASKFNELVGYVCTQIVLPKRVRARAKQMVRFIKIAEHFYQQNNFDSVMAIIGAISNSCVNRLKFTKKEVPKSFWKIYEELDRVTSSVSGYKEYRTLLKTVQPPCIPYLGVFLTDLTFISDGSPDRINGDLINFGKRKLLFTTISEIQRFQITPYNLQKVDQIQKILKSSLEFKSDNDLYEISKEREPRGAQKSQIKF